jgi:hypothetical protein
MRILFIGDVVGKPGLSIVRRLLPGLVDAWRIDLAVANVENIAGGKGVTRQTVDTMLAAGVGVMTSGNHIWDKREALEFIGRQPRLLRPANFPAVVPGRGHYLASTGHGNVAVINLMGRVFMQPLDNPFARALEEIEAVRASARVILVDFHAEATSEKIAMGWHLDGKVTAVIGTHTHVQTADDRILPRGTAYITDAGMTGPHDSVIGIDPEAAISRFLTSLPVSYAPAGDGVRLNAVVVTADAVSGRANSIARVNVAATDLDTLARRTVEKP